VEYALKCSSFGTGPDGHTYLCANEWIAYLLALDLGYPVFPTVVIEGASELLLGFERVDRGVFAVLATTPVIQKARNPEFVYSIAAFDALVLNIDRHAGNVVARRVHAPSCD
jgi:hypothetical protein